MVEPAAEPQREETRRESSLVELIQEVIEETSHLIEKQFELLREELNLVFRTMGTASVKFAAAAVLAIIAIGFLGYSVIVLLSAYVTPWISALIVGLAFLVAGSLLILWGVIDLRGLSLASRTAATMKENVKWLSARSKRPNEK
jgi:hypothetical protein